jgi:hypothetical protein
MKIEIKEVYKCDHCRKLYQRKKACIKHESLCGKNPENETKCFNCEFLEKERLTEYFDTGHGEGQRPVDVFFCKKINSALFPLTIDPNKRIDFDDIENQPMKKNCDQFRDKLAVDFDPY